MENPRQEIRRDANRTMITDTLIIHIIGHDNHEVEYLEFWLVEQLGYDTVGNELAA